MLVIVGALSPAASAQQLATATAPLVFDGVTVVDVVQGKLVPGRRVVIAGNRIQTVGDASTVKIPKGAQVMDVRSKYLIPGLWDMHVHLLNSDTPDRHYPLFVANGVTGIRDAGSYPRTQKLLLSLRSEILAGTRVGPPRQLISGNPISERKRCGLRTNYFFCVSPSDSTDLPRLVDDAFKVPGIDMLKTYELSPAMYFRVAAAARRAGIPFGGHVPPNVTAAGASDSGASILDHLNAAGDLDALCIWRSGLFPEYIPLFPGRQATDSASVEACRPLSERLQRNNTWWVPTLLVFPGLAAWNLAETAAKRNADRVAEYGRKFWRDSVLNSQTSEHADSVPPYIATALLPDSLGLLQIVQAVDLPILAGTDGSPLRNDHEKLPPGFALHAELATYVAEGLTPLRALQAATLNPAKMLHGTDSLGTVAPGKLADLVLLDANPLADITNTTTIRAVVANGRYFDRTALDKLLTDAQANGP